MINLRQKEMNYIGFKCIVSMFGISFVFFIMLDLDEFIRNFEFFKYILQEGWVTWWGLIQVNLYQYYFLMVL